MSGADDLVGVFDRALRALTGGGVAERPAPEAEEGALTEAERKHAAGLMRVNHAGEICAQALYEGQALTARDAQVREALRTAAAEETDHLVWCRERLDELDGRPSMLDPVFYAAFVCPGRGGRGSRRQGEPRLCRGYGRPGEAAPRSPHSRSA